jgi:S1-C subfamily serine protease
VRFATHVPVPLATRLKMLSMAVLLALGCPTDGALAQRSTVQPRVVAPRGELTADERVTIGIFERAKRSVVYISTSERVRDPWTRNVHTIPRGTGSGFVWDERGHVVTNWHVVAGAAEARVRLDDGSDYPTRLVGASQAHDLAVLSIQVPSAPPPPLPVGTSRDLKVGQRVYAIGNPFGLDWSLTTGIVSALDRALDTDNGETIEHLIQTDAAINPGNSGGPLLDSAGRLIGVNTAIYSPSGGSAGVGFAVPIDTVNRVVPQLIAHGRYVPPSIGAEFDDDLNELLSARTRVEGAFVLKVRPKGPAAAAGLRPARLERGVVIPGDVIVSVDDRPVPSPQRLRARLDDFAPGDRVRLGILRDGKRMTLDVALDAAR